VSIVKKSQATMVVACAVRNWRHVGPEQCGAGSSPARLSISHTVEGATRCPSPVSSPWMR
jgi:hypothetical protein